MRFPVNQALPLVALVLIGGCLGGGSGPSKTIEPLATTGPAADYPVTIGAPFVVDGVTHTPSDSLNSDAVGYAATGSDGGGRFN